MVVILFALLLVSCSSDDDENSISGYRTEKIGGQHWMAENLNYKVSGSKCYGDIESNCDKYGRLYNWAAAMALPDSCNYNNCIPRPVVKHRGICPSGWHIPIYAEWKLLVDSVGGSSIAGRYLKATKGWRSCGKDDSYPYKCEDKYGFSAMPGGIGNPTNSFSSEGEFGYWWSATEYRNEDAYYRDLYYMSDAADWWEFGTKSHFRSVRCVRD